MDIVPSLFDGKVCNKCRIWKRYTDFAINRALADNHASFCRVCRSEIHLKRKEENPEEVRQQARSWLAKAKQDRAYADKLRADAAKWERANRERRNEYKVELNRRRLQDPVIAEQRREKRKRDEEARELRRLQRRNPQVRELEIACVRRRAERLKANGGSYTKAERVALFVQYGNKCLRCGRSDVAITADHVIPVLQGGSNLISNIQPLCRRCNSIKGTSTIDYRIQM